MNLTAYNALSSLTESLMNEIRSTRPQPALFAADTHCDLWFEKRALDLFALQFALNTPYQAWCQSLDRIPSTVTTWQEIPSVPVAAFKEFDMTCVPSDQRLWTFHSSRTTGQISSRHYHHRQSLALYETSLITWFSRFFGAFCTESVSEPTPDAVDAVDSVDPDTTACVPTSARWVSLTPTPESVPNSSLVHMLGTAGKLWAQDGLRFVGRLGRSGAWEVDVAALDQEIQSAVESGTPMLLFGTAFNWVHFLDEKNRWVRARERHVLPPGSLVMETGGYKGRSRELSREQLERELTASLGITPGQIVREYGMCELSSQAYEMGSCGMDDPVEKLSDHERMSGVKKGGQGFQFPPWVRVRVLSPETGREVAVGEPGVLQVTDLANAWSVQAVETSDLVIQTSEGKFQLMGRVSGVEPRGCSLRSLNEAESHLTASGVTHGH
jgi:hypothetical protein